MKHNQTTNLILGMLSIEPNRSGYDIRKAVESSVSHFWRESYGQIYPTLKRLVAEGLIVPHQVASKGRPERQAYSLTASGAERLRAWLSAPYHDDPPRNEFLLKLFFGHAASSEACVQHIKTFQNRNQRLLGTLLEIEKFTNARHADHADLPFWLLTLSYGVAQTRASIEWSNAALAHFAGFKGNATKGSMEMAERKNLLNRGKKKSLKRSKT